MIVLFDSIFDKYKQDAMIKILMLRYWSKWCKSPGGQSVITNPRSCHQWKANRWNGFLGIRTNHRCRLNRCWFTTRWILTFKEHDRIIPANAKCGHQACAYKYGTSNHHVPPASNFNDKALLVISTRCNAPEVESLYAKW